MPGRIVGFLRNKRLARIGQLFQPVCKVHVCAGSIIGLVDSVLDDLNDHLAGVNADPDLQIGVVKTFHLLLHGQSGKATPYRMIFMRPWCAKHRHDPIALSLVDDAVIAANRFIHGIESRLQAPHAEFGIAEPINEAG